ncbi:hypothetical protein ACFQ0B_49475 [Nonomuraea thailandensis]
MHTLHADGPRQIPIADFYLLPGDTPHRETVLRPGELITKIDVPITSSPQVRGI